MVFYTFGDITEQKVDAIVNAANAFGYMGGIIGKYLKFAGVSETIHFKTRGQVQKECHGYHKLGSAYVTRSHGLPAPYVIHAVTMIVPGTFSSLSIVHKCLLNVIEVVKQEGYEEIAIPLLGTGSGKVSKRKVRDLMQDILALEEQTYRIVEFVR